MPGCGAADGSTVRKAMVGAGGDLPCGRLGGGGSRGLEETEGSENAETGI